MALEFNDMSRRGQWGVILVLCVALVGVFYIYLWQPNQEEISRLQAEIGQLNLDIQRTRAVAQQLPDLEASLAELERRLEMLSVILPEEQLTDATLRNLQGVASDTGLDVRRFAPRDPVVLDFYAEAPMEFELTGGYHNLASFFDRISKIARVINVDQVNIQTLQGSPGDTIEASVTAKTFFFVDPPPTPEEEEGGGKGKGKGKGR